MKVLGAIAGARVRRVDLPAPDLLAITIRFGAREDATLLISVRDGAAGLGLVRERPVGDPAGAVAQLFRKHLEGSTLIEARPADASTLAITFEHEGARAVVRARVGRRNAGVVLEDASGRRLGGAPRAHASIEAGEGTDATRAREEDWPADLDELYAAGDRILAARSRSAGGERALVLQRQLKKQRARIARRHTAISGDLAATHGAAALRRDAASLLSVLADVPEGVAELEVPDFETGEPRPLVLDTRMSVAANADRWYQRARKLDRGAQIAGLRLADAQAELSAIDAALEALAHGDTTAAEQIVEKEVRGKRGGRPATATAAGPKRVPYRAFVADDGAQILVGRSSKDNARLTFGHARPQDWFLHARGRTGSHVIVRAEAGRPSEATLDQAALLAAHFSAARGDSAAEVLCAPRSQIKRGRAQGQVLVDGVPTRRVRIETEKVEAILKREKR
jgi:predicted ribosome quality control (RQC) complex YloA/Tae2 family protein